MNDQKCVAADEITPQKRIRTDHPEQLARRLAISDRPLAFEHLGVYRILLDGGGSRHRHDFVEDALGPLGRYDAEHGTALLPTLRAYVAADYNANETARRLYVHPNTLAYRLRTIRRLLGGDPARGDLRLTVELALKLQDLPRLSAASAAESPADR